MVCELCLCFVILNREAEISTNCVNRSCVQSSAATKGRALCATSHPSASAQASSRDCLYMLSKHVLVRNVRETVQC